MGGDLVGDEPCTHILGVGQTQVLFGGHVTEHGGTVPAGQGGADGAGDVVVARGDVGDQGTEYIKRRFGAFLHLLAHVHLDLVHGHVAGAFDHHLHVVRPGAAGEFAQGLQFGKLGGVARVVLTAGPQRIAQAEGDVVLLEDVDNLVEVGVERVLFVVGEHPARQDAAAARDDAGEATWVKGKCSIKMPAWMVM